MQVVDDCMHLFQLGRFCAIVGAIEVVLGGLMVKLHMVLGFFCSVNLILCLRSPVSFQAAVLFWMVHF